MTDTSRHDFENIVQELTRCGNSRTWSILVTIFGDLAQNPEDEISGALLSSLTQRIGIKPQAMRVALHRLRRDGWIVTEKFGRTSKHRLSEFGLNQSVVASPKIYARTVEKPDTWHILLANPEAQNGDKTLLTHGYCSVLPGVFLGKGKGPEDAKDFLVLAGDLSTIPVWLQSSIADLATIEEFSRLEQSLAFVNSTLQKGYTPTPVETAVIRTLIVHNWRRIVLRQPDLSLELLPDNSSAQCRTSVWKLLEQLKRPSIDALEAASS
jgi:phenylacetic acid degradation operon negative regulatory protein